MSDDLAWLERERAGRAGAAGKASPAELVEAAIRRIERTNPELNAVIIPRFEKARAEAASRALPDGPFRGVPFLLKDLICYSAGDPHHMGPASCATSGSSRPPTRISPRSSAPRASSSSARRTRPSWARSPPRARGLRPEPQPVGHEPLDRWLERRLGSGRRRGPRPAAHANDGGGSIRIPASECGLVGLKPSRGRISCGPGLGEFLGGLAIEGVLTRSVRDTAAILDAIAGPMPGDPYTAPATARPFAAEVGAAVGKLRVGLLTARRAGSSPRTRTGGGRRGAARLLTSLGHTVEASHPEALDDLESARHFTTMYATGMTHLLDVLGHIVGRKLGPEDVDPLNLGARRDGALLGEEYLATREWIARYTAAWRAGGRAASTSS